MINNQILTAVKLKKIKKIQIKKIIELEMIIMIAIYIQQIIQKYKIHGKIKKILDNEIKINQIVYHIMKKKKLILIMISIKKIENIINKIALFYNHPVLEYVG